MAKRKRYSRPHYRWTDDLDVILGVAALVAAIAIAVERAGHVW